MTAYTIFHVALSLIGIATGFVAVLGMVQGRLLPGWTKWFLAMTTATSVTGFGFPFVKFLPSHGVGIISLVALGVAYWALYGRRLAGGWRLAYVVTAVLSQYLNVFVLVVQMFLKIPALKALAPNQTEPPFAIAQGVVLVAFLALGYLAVRRFRRAGA